MTKPESPPIFGSFALLAKLAKGDIGDLYLARRQGAGGFEKLVVIKHIREDLIRDPELAALFVSEARLAARIEHPNIRKVYELGSSENHHFIALEYLRGVPLVEVLLARKRVPRLADARLIAALMAQACQGLHAAHSLSEPRGGLVHGDLNPRSIFITASGYAKVLDFDIVEMRSVLSERHGFVRRTCAYMATEQVRAGHSDHRGDIFSLGVVTWEALTGRRLFKQKTRDLTLAAIDRGAIPTPRTFRSELSDEIDEAVMRALARDPANRFQTAREFGMALEKAALAEGPPLTPLNVAELIQESFAEALTEQNDFVRMARDGNAAPAPSGQKPRAGASSRVGKDPDDWNSDTKAETRVAGVGLAATLASLERTDEPDQFGAQVGDPFAEISVNIDLSEAPPEPADWQDTGSLVLRESNQALAELEAEQEDGVVVVESNSWPHSDGIAVIENLHQSSSAGMPRARRPSRGVSAVVPRPLSAPAAVPRPLTRSKFASRSLSSPATMPPRPLTSQSEISSLRLDSSVVEPGRGAARPAAKSGWLVRGALTAMIAAAATFALLRYTRDKSATPESAAPTAARPSPASAVEATEHLPPSLGAANETNGAGDEPGTPIASKDGEQPEAPADSQNRGAATATGILAAATDPATEPEPTETKPAQDEPKVKASEPDLEPARKPVRKPAREERKAERQVRRKSVDKPARAATASGPGFLTVNAAPYATVFVDGKKKGITPLVKLELPPGPHTIKLVSSADGKSKTLRVQIEPKAEVRHLVKF